MIHILHIDTSGPTGLVALATDRRLIAVRKNEQERDHATALNGMIDGVLQEAGLKASDLSAVAVCSGPGSYTGLRIGMATAKGLCYALDIPLILHGRLALLLYTGLALHPEAAMYAAVLPARTGEYFLALGSRETPLLVPPGHFSTVDALELLRTHSEKSIVVVGHWEEDLAVLSQESTVSYTNQFQADLSIWIIYTFDSWENNTFADAARAEPQYLKSVYIAKAN